MSSTGFPCSLRAAHWWHSRTIRPSSRLIDQLSSRPKPQSYRDWYCKSATEIERTLLTLESKTPEQRLFLSPQATPLPACGDKAGFQTDADLSELQWDYFDLARSQPRVLGLMSFGLWVAQTSASQVPQTIDGHERIAARVMSAPTAHP
ncbi:hypothetical protein ACFXJ8_15135 [Nonomuraea sp. NPDC059194]|uniref:hypothetical protein n=1 Tax=Nonomuraea sp. NPDC059194 TaxID=3346764 RepID=UPI0036B7446D